MCVYLCGDCTCVRIFLKKSNGMRHISSQHGQGATQLDAHVLAFQSKCGRWIDVRGAIREFPTQEEKLMYVTCGDVALEN